MEQEYWQYLRQRGVNTENPVVQELINERQRTSEGQECLWNAYFSMLNYQENPYIRIEIKIPTAFFIAAVRNRYLP